MRDLIIPGEIIREYYGRVDCNDVDWAIALFAESAIYRRAEACYRGLKEIDKFFRQERKIRGRHQIDAMWSLECKVICLGTFDGVGASGDSRHVRFSDFWSFDSNGLVIERQTFLALGQSYVKD